MLPPMKEYLTITQEEMYTLLQSRCNGDLSNLTAEMKDEILQPYKGYFLNIPKLIKIQQKIEKYFSIIHNKPITNMKKFLKFIEKINSILKIYCPCKKGCSCCCSKPIKISIVEVILIEEYLLSKRLNSIYKRNKNTIEDMMARSHNYLFGEEYQGIKCPFLKNNECTVYVVRPYACREYMTFENDNKKCESNDGYISRFKNEINDQIYININKDYLDKNPLTETNCVPFGDIREYFEKV